MTRGARVYFVDADARCWRVLDGAMGAPHAPPFRTVLRPPGWPAARERFFVPRGHHAALRCVSYWGLSPTANLRDLPPDQRALDPAVLAEQLRRSGVPVTRRRMQLSPSTMPRGLPDLRAAAVTPA